MKNIVLLLFLFSFQALSIEGNLHGNYYDFEYNLEDMIKQNDEMWECFARSGEDIYNGVHPVLETAQMVAVTRCGYLSATPELCQFIECKPYEFKN